MNLTMDTNTVYAVIAVAAFACLAFVCWAITR